MDKRLDNQSKDTWMQIVCEKIKDFNDCPKRAEVREERRKVDGERRKEIK